VSCCAVAAGSAAARPLRLLQPGESLLLLLLLLAPCVLLLVQAWGSGIAAPSCPRLRALLTAHLAGGFPFALMFALSSPFAVVVIVPGGGGSGARRAAQSLVGCSHMGSSGWRWYMSMSWRYYERAMCHTMKARTLLTLNT